MNRKLLCFVPSSDVHLLNLHAHRRRRLSNDASIKRELLGLPRDLRLQIADSSRDLGLLTGSSDADGIQLGQLRTKVPIALAQSFDLDLEFRALLRRFQSVVTGVEPPELINEVHRDGHEDETDAYKNQTPLRRVRPNDEAGSSVRAAHAGRREDGLRRHSIGAVADRSGLSAVAAVSAHHDGCAGAPCGKATDA